MKSFISLEEAIDILDANVKAIGTEEVELIKATGRIISEDIYSKIDNPPFNKSAMDGYAIIAEDSNGCNEIKVIDKVFAGEVSKAEVINKTAVRIMTGAPIPKGANAVIKQEDTIKGDNEFITLKKVIKENTGISKINVFKKPKIALISTGDEVIDVGNILTEGKIYNSNKYSIISRIFELGYSICEIQHAGDAEGEIGSYIEKLSKKFDLIITTGGVSVGEKDLLNEAMDKINGKRLFWKVKIKPGSAVLCSIVNNSIIISLSGNPTAALTAFELFVKTSWEKLCGKEKIEIKREKAILCDSFNKKSPQRRFIRGRVEIREEKQNVYITQVKNGNGILSSNLNSNCMIEVEAGNKGLQSGCIVNIIKF